MGTDPVMPARGGAPRDGRWRATVVVVRSFRASTVAVRCGLGRVRVPAGAGALVDGLA